MRRPLRPVSSPVPSGRWWVIWYARHALRGRIDRPDGLLKALTKTVLEAALQEEMTEHLGYDRHAAAGRGSGNSRNGSRNKKVITDACGQVEIAVPVTATAPSSR